MVFEAKFARRAAETRSRTSLAKRRSNTPSAGLASETAAANTAAELAAEPHAPWMLARVREVNMAEIVWCHDDALELVCGPGV